jgi:hypothetical protein
MSLNFSKKEIAWIIITILIFGFIISLPELSISSPYIFLISAIIVLTSVLVKKISANHYSLKIEHKIWGFKQFWFYEKSKFKKPIPIGLLFPFFIPILSLGIFKPLTFLQFNAKNLPKKRALKKRGQHRYSEINESDLAFTSAWGFWALILLAIIGIFINQPELSKYSIYYGLWNLLPISNLDGTKLFFGSLINWILLAIAYLISLVVLI